MSEKREATTTPTAPVLTRRAAVAGAGAAAVGIGLLAAGCSGGGSGSTSTSASGTGGGAAPAAAPAAITLGPASSVPVGGAEVFPDQKVIVTQPTAGNYVGLSAVCTHQGCTVTGVQGATLVCPCHGSTYDLQGKVLKGPAPRALSSATVTVSGGQITLA
ncbi:Rieske (2Fe-2S) protein [Pseudonocardia sp. RS11V-5]|uniref:QcrA and Rieske domain-containing protein n=1 Tax=Pseudonocardia terrae TaxID=2905831 RepID=UPI001E3F1447|nr:Rieske (2Fe-2S) protein [Pseudonocardia terrae]MCE3555080.1 Rieske (2Fe-2S) protein [Pseudonocardia terrae]